eukprot:206030_1
MATWVETVNNWSSEYPSPEELLFGSVGAWLYLYLGHRNIFGITHRIVPTVNIAFIHLSGCMAYVVNHYLSQTKPYMVLLMTYSVLFYVLYYMLIFRPVWKAQLMSTTRFILLVLFGLVYTIIFILCETIAEIFLYGTLFRDPKFDPLLPKLFIVIIACIGWYAILLCHYPDLKAQLLRTC